MRLLGVLVRVEALKAVKRPAFWVTVGVFVAFSAIANFAPGGGSERAGFPDAWRGIIEPAINLGPVFLAALMILLFAPEFRWRTARQNVIDGLSKEQFQWAKVLLLAALAALFFVTSLVIGTLPFVLDPGGGGGAFVEPMDLNYMLGFVVALLLWGTAALMISALVRAAGAGLGLLFLYFICEQIVTALLSSRWSALERFFAYLPGQLFQTITNSAVYYPEVLARTNAARAERDQELLVYPDLWIPLVAATAYVVLFLGLAYVNMRRRDL
ncbi:MAG: hypothetical protein F4106_08525 [Gemmatimonadetes bacterium]|nr:hypothetical protein [Gemmatimonadota bacterium]MYC92917.1 hypothetical protein [Gemmatimonadota bacterium]MYG37334.1 hypothetical protein [Gemmatimonadota bacterium]MYJ18075.1 hypothetical protein [Gemmatimonadota bacterium]